MVRQYQVIQTRPGAITLKVVKGTRYDDTVFEEILGILRRYLGESTAIDVQYVDSIPMVRTGKRLAAVSTIPIDFQELKQPVIALGGTDSPS